MSKYLALFIALLLSITTSWAGSLLPKVKRDIPQRGVSPFRSGQVRLTTTRLESELLSLLAELGLEVHPNAKHRISVELQTDIEGLPQGNEEAYKLSITSDLISLKAYTDTGLYRGLQTLRQLYERGGWTARVILDWPAFPWRGFMMDVGRTYIPLEELKQEIDLLARFKVNVFHWHLTENEAWRLESKLYPKLNDRASMTRMAGRYYTQEEARELVQYCKARRVLLIPEIDMPGHSAAFECALGYGMQTERGKQTLKALIKEACEVFDVPYLHIGTDEVQFTDRAFVPEMVAYVRSLGKKVISWAPGWHYQRGEVDMLQLWSSRGKAIEGIPALDCRYYYLNHYDLFSDIGRLYNSRIYGEDKGSENLYGALLAVWTDRDTQSVWQIVRENQLYPAMLALAERSWVGGGRGDFTSREVMTSDPKSPAYEDFNDFETRMLHYRKAFPPKLFPYVRQVDARWIISAPFPNGGELGRVFPPEEALGCITPPESLPSYTYEGKAYSSQVVAGSGFYLRHVWGDLCAGLLERPETDHTCYAMAWVNSPKEQKVGLLFETQNYSRSEKDLPPPLGAWDYRGSMVWVNGTPIKPPVWTNSHTIPSLTTALGNENACSRPPIPITLKKGWNQLFIKLPIGAFTTREVRLVKWMFTAALVSLDGTEAADVRYLDL
ncbi:family 20 glycosylhydrolase [Porphyromonas catoniae]